MLSYLSITAALKEMSVCDWRTTVLLSKQMIVILYHDLANAAVERYEISLYRLLSYSKIPRYFRLPKKCLWFNKQTEHFHKS